LYLRVGAVDGLVLEGDRRQRVGDDGREIDSLQEICEESNEFLLLAGGPVLPVLRENPAGHVVEVEHLVRRLANLRAPFSGLGGLGRLGLDDGQYPRERRLDEVPRPERGYGGQERSLRSLCLGPDRKGAEGKGTDEPHEAEEPASVSRKDRLIPREK
jgi:hypothetical protein